MAAVPSEEVEQCPFKQLTTSDDALLEALKLIPAFSDGCPFPKGSRGDAMLLKVLDAMPEGELPRLKQLLSRNASHLQARLGIDGGSWDSVIVGCTSERSSRKSSGVNDKAAAELLAHHQQKLDYRPPLSKLLKEGTKAVHAAAEKTHFVREFIKGRCERLSYAMMIKDLYFVYAALELAADRCAADSTFGPLHYPHELGRTLALEADMTCLFGPQWRTDPRCVPSAAARTYTARLAKVAAHSPELMIAHSYTRYLGDLSGGRVLMRVARRLLELPPDSDDGVRFYIFENLSAEPKAFKTRYRHTLDSLCVSDELASQIVAEANLAFHLNIGLFLELDALNGHEEEEPASLTTETLVDGAGDGALHALSTDASVTAAAPAAGCPFAKYAAQSGSPSMKCQRFAAAERAAAERARERQRVSSHLSRSKARLLSWLRPTSSKLVPLLVPLFVLGLAMVVLFFLCTRQSSEYRAPALAPWRQPLSWCRAGR